MSMIEQLSVSLQDFLPRLGRQVRVRPGGTTIISNRLYDAIQQYSEHHGVPFAHVLSQLQDEIQKGT